MKGEPVRSDAEDRVNVVFFQIYDYFLSFVECLSYIGLFMCAREGLYSRLNF